MEDQKISFETAKLAKEKGFNEVQTNGFEESGKPYYGVTHKNSLNTQTGKGYSRPTQSLLAKWLKDIYKLHIDVQPRHSTWVFYIYDLNNWNKVCLLNIDWWQSNDDFAKIGIPSILNTFEDAREIGLQEALKLIKTKKDD